MKVKSKKGNSTMEVQFKFERETPGAVRYHEVDGNGQPRIKDEDGALIGTLYFRKAGAFPKGNYPKKLTITIAA